MNNQLKNNTTDGKDESFAILQNELKRNNEKLNAYKVALDQSLKKCRDLEEENKTLTIQLQSINNNQRSEKDPEKNKIKEQNETLRNQNIQLEKNINRINKDNAKLTDLLQKQNIQIVQLEKENREMKMKIDFKDDDYQDIVNASLRNELDILKAQLSNIQSQKLIQLRSNNSIKYETAIQKTIIDQKNQIETLKSFQKQLLIRIDQESKEINQLIIDLDQKETKIRLLQKDLDEARDELQKNLESQFF